jgi:hypothetical protein
VGRAARAGGRVLATGAGLAGPAARIDDVTGPLTGPVLRPLGRALAPLGAALGPVGSALGPVAGGVGGLLGPLAPGLPGLAGPEAPAGPDSRRAGLAGTGPAVALLSASQTSPARLPAVGADAADARPGRSWPALTGAVSLPGVPAPAELPAGGPDPLSTSAPSGAGFGLAALVAVLLLLRPLGRGRARPERSGTLSRSYLPLVSPA